MKKFLALVASVFIAVNAFAAPPVPIKKQLVGLGIHPEAAAYLAKVVSGAPGSDYEAVAAAGSSQGTAAALSAIKYVHNVSAADGTKGVILPASAVTLGQNVHWILGTTAAVLKIYPATGGTINGGSANAAFSFTTGILLHLCVTTGTADTWFCA